MKHTETVLCRVTPKDGEVATGAPPDDAFREANPNNISGELWSAILKHARGCEPQAYEDLYLRLRQFRQCFTPRVFPDPEDAYRQFVGELVDQIRYGLLVDPRALWIQARKSAVRKASNRIRCLTMAARVLSTLPKRHREILIRAQLALYSSARLGREIHGTPARTADIGDGRVFNGTPASPTLRKPIVRGISAANYKTPTAVA
jgi:hypothetical protein